MLIFVLCCSSRSIAFADIKENKNLADFVLRVFLVPSRLFCASFCSRDPECKSYSFCGDRICSLSNISSSDPDFGQSLVDNHECSYLGLLDVDKPNCSMGVNETDIQDDSDSSGCDINRKRQDGSWTDWSGWTEMAVEDPDEWKMTRARTCQPSPAHGGKGCSGIGQKWRILMFLRVLATFQAAVALCAGESALVFDDVRHSFMTGVIAERIADNECFYVGVTDLVTDLQFVDLDGEDVGGFMEWDEEAGEPSNSPEETSVFGKGNPIKYHSVDPNHMCQAVCERYTEE